MALSVVKAYGATSSRTLRGIIVHELHRAHSEQADFSSWTSPQSRDQLARLLELPTLDPADYTNRITNPITNPITNRITNHIGNAREVGNTNGIGNTDPGADYQSDYQCDSVDFLPATATATSRQQTEGGYVSPEGHLRDDSTHPSPHCPRHPGGTDAPCRACGDAKRAHREWEAQRDLAVIAARSAAALERAELRARAILECELCDDEGYAGTAVCDHDPHTVERAQRGMAAVRAAIAKPKGAA